jgi:hypothetical protein
MSVGFVGGGRVHTVGKVGEVGKVGRDGLIMPTWNQLRLPVHCGILAFSWQEFLSMLAPYLVEETDNLDEFKGTVQRDRSGRN